MRFLRVPFLIALSIGGTLVLGATAASPTVSLTERERALHVLNRLGFGPRPGDVERVLAMGVDRWVDAQLHPDRLADAGVAPRLAGIETLSMSNAELIARFETPVREARRKLKAEKTGAQEGAGEADLQRLKDLIPPENRPRRIVEELAAARVLRAVGSERQLNEVLVDFWMNHFNVYANKGVDRVLITSFERDTIRPRIWGKFEDLLEATAKSPAMLFYLDNARSVADAGHRAAGTRPLRLARLGPNAPQGLNENYARELMELHTLGVDGGYTQTDVTELARVLTGWSIARPRGDAVEAGAFRGFHRSRETTAQPGEFLFREALHDVGEKKVLGEVFEAGGGMEEGERALRMLARQAATARHIAFQLAQRLVADEPPAALVERAAGVFRKTGGDLRETVRAIVESREFFDPRYYRAKIKSPFEYVVSAIRAVGGSTDGRALARQIAEMGEPLYLCQPPTGYSDTAEAWVNSGALLARLNFALALANGGFRGTAADPSRLLAGVDPSVGPISRALLGTELSENTRRTIGERVASDAAAEPKTLIAGLVLGSPEFQRQ